MFAHEVYNAPATIPLLDVCDRERRYLGTPESAAEENSQDGAIAQPLYRGDIRRAEERLRLP